MAVRLNEPEIRTLLGPSGPVAREVAKVAADVAAAARANIHSQTGRLAASIHTDLSANNAEIRATIGTRLPYAAYVHGGTGLYGPSHAVIRPHTASVLAFEIGGRKVFARFVRGQKPNPFLLNALRAASPWPVREL